MKQKNKTNSKPKTIMILLCNSIYDKFTTSKNKIKILLLLATTIFLLHSCDKEPVTYRFSNEDKPKLLSHYFESQILTYVNEVGEERKFKIDKIEQIIETQCWIMGGCSAGYPDFFYCEPKNIFLTDLTTQNAFYISLARFPIAMNEAEQDNYHLQPSSLFGRIGSMSWHIYFFGFEFSFEEAVQKQRFSDNDFIYNNNMIIIHFKAAGKYDEGGGMLTDAKIIYYDIYQGLVGFDDINDQQWRLK